MYDLLEYLYNLFTNYNFTLNKKEILLNQFKLEFIKSGNYIDIFSIDFVNNQYQLVVPLKNFNTSYKTSITNFENLYSFLEFHLYNYSIK